MEKRLRSETPIERLKASVFNGRQVQVGIIPLSAPMTATKPAQKEVIDLLNEIASSIEFLVMAGDAPRTSESARQIDPDGWAETAEQGVGAAQELAKGT
jgi:methanogenic corrinoid protein MtbC1